MSNYSNYHTTGNILRNQWQTLRQEAFLMSSTLCCGLEELRLSESLNPGFIYSGLFSTAIGAERLLKLAFAVTTFVDTGGKFPNGQVFKGWNHKLLDLFRSVKKQSLSLNLTEEDDWDYGDSYESQYLMKFLGHFASVDRYFNLNNLQCPSTDIDPLIQWRSVLFEIVKHKKKGARQIAPWGLEANDEFDHPLSKTRVFIGQATKYGVAQITMVLRPVILTLNKAGLVAQGVYPDQDYPIPVFDEFLPGWPEDFNSALNIKRFRDRSGKYN